MKDQKILVIGLGISGRSAAEFLLKKGYTVWGVDKNYEHLQHSSEVAVLVQKGMQISQDSEKLDLKQFNKVVLSPGVPQTHPLCLEAHALGIEVLGEVEIACRFLPNSPFLGITGTNGKTTVTLLVNHVLNHSGRPARALGNVGTPITSSLNGEKLDLNPIIVAELSSYQLETMHSKVIDVAVVLNITPDHLDRYATMEEYAKAKMQIGFCLKEEGTLYVEHRTAQAYGHLLEGISYKSYGYEPSCDLYTDLQSLFFNHKNIHSLPPANVGRRSHDLENMMAAFALCHHCSVTPSEFFEALKSFTKPHHRIEFVRCQGKVNYYDDSKGTNLDAVIRAVEALETPIMLIAGGVDKGAPYTPWIEAFAGKVKAIFAIGQAAPKIHMDIGHQIPVHLCSNLEAAVKRAAEYAQEGDSVLLSPGCSSFDMFRDYVHRGEEFIRIVKAL